MSREFTRIWVLDCPSLQVGARVGVPVETLSSKFLDGLRSLDGGDARCGGILYCAAPDVALLCNRQFIQEALAVIT